ncbi:hypothetical protein F2P81_017425 [Scophthalmus maximus]|uniref:Uncharacterized protein n=1 Tax=Scophthalmus maximus TaxID=52904 RepID=A0A6A4SIA1_SCOMX|nr:hypothetical protein F2P81_017425 [Scophthalmus maximus]
MRSFPQPFGSRGGSVSNHSPVQLGSTQPLGTVRLLCAHIVSQVKVKAVRRDWTVTCYKSENPKESKSC